MKHLTEEELTLAYYGDVDRQVRRHLNQCEHCQAAFAREQRLISGLADYAIPGRGETYGSEVWTRLLPQLPILKPRRRWFTWWTLTPALASLLVIAFFAGIVVERQKKAQGFPPGARDRVLLLTMGNHLDRSEMLLAEVENASAGSLDLTEERTLASDLVGENRLLRLTAARNGQSSEASLLDELERVLLDLAHSPANLSAQDLETLQRRLERDGILFKVRIIRSNIQEKRQKL